MLHCNCPCSSLRSQSVLLHSILFFGNLSSHATFFHHGILGQHRSSPTTMRELVKITTKKKKRVEHSIESRLIDSRSVEKSYNWQSLSGENVDEVGEKCTIENGRRENLKFPFLTNRIVCRLLVFCGISRHIVGLTQDISRDTR